MASDALTLRGFRRWRADGGAAAVVGFGGLFPLFSLRYPSKTQQKKLRLFPSSFSVLARQNYKQLGRWRENALPSFARPDSRGRPSPHKPSRGEPKLIPSAFSEDRVGVFVIA